ncbi:MAG: hypothetical protein V3V15_01520 [Sphingorhabdus sp.]
MNKLLIAGALALSMSAFAAQPASAHPENNIKPAGKCDTVSEAEWRLVKNGMTLLQVEHVLGCHGSHMSEHKFKAGISNYYIFKKGSKHLVGVAIRAGKVWMKRRH